MTKRLLIVSGCSNTEHEWYKDEFGIIAWPVIVAQELDLKLLNLARRGASNHYIENSIIDAVLKYKDEDPLVMALWTDTKRLNGNDCYSYVDPKYNDQWIEFKDIEDMEKPYTIVKCSLRSIWRTKTIVENLGLRYVDYLGDFHIPNLTKGSLANAYKNIRSDWYFNNLNFTMREIESGGIDYTRIPIDGHPDQSGHEKIANIMINRYMNQLKKKVEFTYD